MTLRSLVVLSLVLCASAASASPQPSSRRAADLILAGGKIFTADTARPWAQALTIRGERIVAVGTSAE